MRRFIIIIIVEVLERKSSGSRLLLVVRVWCHGFYYIVLPISAWGLLLWQAEEGDG